MNWKKLAAIAACTALTLGTVTAVTAAQGDADDPLVTLSYLTQIFTPKAESQVDEAVRANEEELRAQLDLAVSSYEQRVEDALGAAGGVFTARELKEGESVSFAGGHEVLLVSGSAVAVGTLTDTTAGVTLSAGEALVAGHLYITAGDGAGLRAEGPARIMSR